MRLAPYALLSLFALPGCAPYGYGYSGTYGAPGYAAPGYGGQVYGDPGLYYPPPYVAPAEPGLLLFGGGRDERRRGDYRRRDEGRHDVGRRPANVVRPDRGPPAARRGAIGRGGPGPSDRQSHFNPADPTLHGGSDR